MVTITVSMLKRRTLMVMITVTGKRTDMQASRQKDKQTYRHTDIGLIQPIGIEQ